MNENQVEVGHIEISCPHCDAADACDRHEQLIAALATPADDDSALGLRQSMADEWRDLLVNLWPITYQQWTGQKWYLKMATGLQVFFSIPSYWLFFGIPDIPACSVFVVFFSILSY